MRKLVYVILTTMAVVTDAPEPAAAAPGGGMGDMDY